MKIRVLTISLMVSVASGLVGFPTQTYAQVFNLNQIASSTQSNPYFGVIMGNGIGSHKATASGTPTVAGIVATSSTASLFANATSTLFTATTAWITNLFIGVDTVAEYISDTVGAMFSGNTETDITITYDDSDNTIDAVVDTLPNLTGTLDVDSGGTGAATLTGLLQGNGTSAITGISNSSTVGQVLRVSGASTYAWGALDLSDSDAITGDLPFANLTQGAANTVLANITGSTADFAAVATSSLYAGTNGQVLARVAGAWQGVATTTFSGGLTYSGGNVTADLGTSIVVGELASADFGDWTCNGTTCVIDANSVALTTDTTGNYVETITGTANQIAVSGSGAEDADVTISIPADFRVSSSTLSGSTLLSNATTSTFAVTNLTAANCDVKSTTSGSFFCGTDATGGGSGGGTFSTTTSTVSGQFVNYPNNDTDIVAIGANSTTTAEYYFDPNTNTAQFEGGATTTLGFNSTGLNAAYRMGITFNEADTVPFSMGILYDGSGTGNANKISIWEGTTAERFTFTRGGNFGIATSSPYAPLSVVGEIVASRFTATSTTASQFVNATSTLFTATTGWFTNLFMGADTIAEYISDTVGAMFSSNTETDITITYDDADNTIDAVVDTLPNLTGTLDIDSGGTGTTTTAAGYAAYWGTSAILGTPTTTASCTTGVSCTSFNVFGATPISITATLGTSVDLTSEVTDDLPFANLAQVSANSVLGNITGSTADASSIATSSLFSFSSAFSTTGTIKNIVERSFTISTSTAWTGTTTNPVLQATLASTILGYRCKTYTGFGSPAPGGTLNIQIGNYSASTTLANASSTNNFNGSSFDVAAGDSIYITAGTPASSPTKLNCTLQFSI